MEGNILSRFFVLYEEFNYFQQSVIKFYIWIEQVLR